MNISLHQSEDKTLNVVAILYEVSLTLENSPVLATQVGDQLIALRSMGLKVALITIFEDQDAFDVTIGHRLRAAGVVCNLVCRRGILFDLLKMRSAWKRLLERNVVTKVYVRGIWGALIIAPVPFASWQRYTYDVRGALADECAAVGTGWLKVTLYKALERFFIKHASHVTTVSADLSRNIQVSVPYLRVLTIPSCVEVEQFRTSSVERSALRELLGYRNKDIIITYCGGLSHYQQIPFMLGIWRELLEVDDVRFLMLTNSTPQSRVQNIGELDEFGSRLRRMSASRDEVPRMLSIASIGFMLRDARELNRAASPVKFAEYVAAGLAVVGSPGTGDVSSLIVNRDIGVLVSPEHPTDASKLVKGLISRVRDDSTGFRHRAQQLASEKFNWRAHSEKFREMYMS